MGGSHTTLSLISLTSENVRHSADPSITVTATHYLVAAMETQSKGTFPNLFGELDTPSWFRRLADIPGMRFEPHQTLDRTKLRGHDSVPKVEVYEFDGKPYQSLLWSINNGETSASPARQHALREYGGVSSTKLIRNAYQCLELPGCPSDYHFLIQSCAQELWKRRREEPCVLEDVENLCWLDIQLIQTRPDVITDEFAGEPKFYNVVAFSTLIEMYEREGFLQEAEEVAARAGAFKQCERDRQRLRERIAAVEAEDGD